MKQKLRDCHSCWRKTVQVKVNLYAYCLTWGTRGWYCPCCGSTVIENKHNVDMNIGRDLGNIKPTFF